MEVVTTPTTQPIVRVFCVMAVTIGLAVGLSVIVPVSATAQTGLPSDAEPDQLKRRFEVPEVPRATDEKIVIPGAADTTAPPAGADLVMFVLGGVMVEGATVFAPDDFLLLYEQYLGKKISLATVYEIANAITAKYGSAGYLLSQAIAPEQRIGKDGLVRIRIIEGFVDKVIIEGNVGGRRGLLESMGAKIKAAMPLDAGTLERYLLLADDLPGATVRGVLKPSPDTLGAANLIFVIEHKAVDAFASIDNRGTKYVGPLQAVVGGSLNSVFGRYEKTGLQAITTGNAQELRYASLNHEETLNAEGSKITFNASWSQAELGATLKDDDIDSKSLSFALTLSHPVIRSRARNLALRANVGYKNTRTDQASALLTEDRLRSLRLGGSYDFVDTFLTSAVTLISLEVSKGFDILDNRPTGSEKLSRSRGRSDYAKINADLNRVQQLGGGFSLLAGASGQYAPHPLLSAEEFAFGGSRFGRGLNSSELTGDTGVAAKLELQYGEKLSGPLPKDYQAYGFYDFGAVWNHDQDNRQTGATAGLGVRSNLTDWASLNLELAKPLTQGVAARAGKGSENDVRGYFSLIVRY